MISNKAVKKRKKKQLQRQSVEATNFQRISDQKERDHFELPLTITLEIRIEIKKVGGGDGALLMLTIQDRGLYEC